MTKQDETDLKNWLKENNAKRVIKYDTDTGRPSLVYSIDLRDIPAEVKKP